MMSYLTPLVITVLLFNVIWDIRTMRYTNSGRLMRTPSFSEETMIAGIYFLPLTRLS